MSAAVAEAHFRRALATRVEVSESVADLRRTVELFPEEARFWYQLGLMLHRSDRLEEARQAYARAADLGLVRRGIGFVRGLAELELDPKISLDTLQWLTLEAQTNLIPIAGLLRGEPCIAPTPPPHDNVSKTPSIVDPVSSLWQGLTLLACGAASEACTMLSPPKGQRLLVGAEPIRAFYCGVAAAVAGKPQAALTVWREMMRLSPLAAVARPRHLNSYISQVSAHSILALQKEEQWEEALKQAQSGAALAPDDTWLLQAVLVAASRAATACREAEDWTGAVARWEIMRGILEQHPSLGPMRPVLHNLAVANEALEEWETAAQAWIALLNTLPRRSGRTTSKTAVSIMAGPSVEAKRAWMRRRILDNFQRADLPDEAMAYYKQAVKADPENLDLRLEMASALLANEQIIAGRNEVQRILDKNPKCVDALLLLAEIHKSRGEDPEAEQVLNRVLQIDPEHGAARKAIRLILLERGINAFNASMYHKAREIYKIALKHAPNDPVLLVFLGQTERVLGKTKEAQSCFDAALATGTSEAYVQMFALYGRAHKEAEARDILQRAEQTEVANSPFYLRLGTLCFTYIAAAGAAGTRHGLPAPPVWVKWGRELVEKGLDIAPNRIEALESLVENLGPEYAAITVDYVRQLVVLQPDDPELCLDLAVYQGYTKDVAGARKTLALAERAARKQGRKDLIDVIARLRQDVGSPMFRMLGYFSDEDD